MDLCRIKRAGEISQGRLNNLLRLKRKEL